MNKSLSPDFSDKALTISSSDKDSEHKIGLVLAGGGAKGAYEAGALRYLAEINFAPHIIAGTSIGALNGAVIASYPDFSVAVEQLNILWDKLGSEKVLHLNPGGIGLDRNKVSLFNPDTVEKLLKEAVKPAAIRSGKELWVAVFPALKIPGINYDHLLGMLTVLAGTSAKWLRVQDCGDDELLYNLLLASAAIPFAFPPREINGKYFVDGALGDNVPLGALSKEGCTHAIVIHLENAVTWNRHDFPEQAIIEIRPTQSLNKNQALIAGDITSMLDFSSERISQLKQQGYQDAKHCLEPILRSFTSLSELRLQDNILKNKTEELQGDDPVW
ncbi:MAG: patatin-like phospholipase family protein [Okeania sp. SIO3H1]|uniref:patatin-like phospholipase family protein n=1 Tax=Okeania sp. SIO1I7 TaxID=2607772 RepID=UPI0013CD89B1|nr:patatin-like phospholipase family protein [Okeania sp. SIO1I7]NEN92129.1 patatin-like phospholipase family protein [Okeania sp. SIO3H1]NET28165.1 patatin-like phospholipase family protein [Okeania sp. SIO1I7]